jgi:hypothetical protein
VAAAGEDEQSILVTPTEPCGTGLLILAVRGVGSPLGAEALLVADHDPRVDAVVVVAPSPAVWAGIARDDSANGRRHPSHWTLAGAPLPFVPFVADWERDRDPPAFRELYAKSLSTNPEAARGDTSAADPELGRLTWPSVTRALRLRA